MGGTGELAATQTGGARKQKELRVRQRRTRPADTPPGGMCDVLCWVFAFHKINTPVNLL